MRCADDRNLLQYQEEEDEVDDADHPSTGTDAASLRSITFSNLRHEQEPQLLCNFLMELGACSSSIIDADRGTPQEQGLFHEFDPTGKTRAALPITEVWDVCHVSAHFPASTDLEWIMDIVQENFPSLLPSYTVTQVEDKDWVLHVQQSWDPIVVPPFVLRFPWHSQDMVAKALKNRANSNEQDDNMVELKLQGGIAFGTGEHPTTQLCLEWLARIIQEQPSRFYQPCECCRKSQQRFC